MRHVVADKLCALARRAIPGVKCFVRPQWDGCYIGVGFQLGRLRHAIVIKGDARKTKDCSRLIRDLAKIVRKDRAGQMCPGELRYAR